MTCNECWSCWFKLWILHVSAQFINIIVEGVYTVPWCSFIPVKFRSLFAITCHTHLHPIMPTCQTPSIGIQSFQPIFIVFYITLILRFMSHVLKSPAVLTDINIFRFRPRNKWIFLCYLHKWWPFCIFHVLTDNREGKLGCFLCLVLPGIGL